LVGAAVILGVIVLLLVRMKVARVSVVVVCVLFGLTLGATPIGDGVNHSFSELGGWLAEQLRGL
jgi:hypothetical protein